ncbi:putative monooxygenase [Hypomontagnella submonticulosa]|nr:putative monooxygenase [Hypomontagnella submonticulosa]
MTSNTAKPHVLIIGAGLGGLTLAQCLRKQNVPFEIFDRDTDVVSRQGWAIGLHTLLDELVESIPQDMPPFKEKVNHLWPLKLEAQLGLYFQGQRFVVESTPDAPVVRANRYLFREWLTTKLPIQWGKRARRVEETENGVRVHFEDGTTATGDILVGADGTKSVVREHVLGRPNEETLKTIPVRIIVGETTMSGEAFERQLSMGHSGWVKSDWEGGKYFMFVGLKHTNPDANSGQYYWFVAAEDHDLDNKDHWIHSASQSDLLEHVTKQISASEPKFKEVVEATPVSGMRPGGFILRDAELSDLPVSRTTLLGDAVHPMAPFRGEGGVHALRDALNLGKAIGQLNSTSYHDIKAALGPYQQEVIERGVPAVLASRNAYKTNAGGGGKFYGWGKPAVPKVEEKISLKDCRP